jgi:hypothetical protein
MSNIIDFNSRRKRLPPQLEPTLTIHIYDNPDDDGFYWTVTGEGEPPSQDYLSSYLADMFVSLTEQDNPPGIFDRFGAFLRRLFKLNKGQDT